MSLIKCKECGHGVSTDVTRCPHCGADMRKKQNRLLNIISLIGAIGLVGYCSSNDSATNQPQEIKASAPLSEEKDLAANPEQDAIKETPSQQKQSIKNLSPQEELDVIDAGTNGRYVVFYSALHDFKPFYIRQCAEASCEPVAVIIQKSNAVWIDRKQGILQTKNGANWAKTIYFGTYCAPSDFDESTAICNKTSQTIDTPLSGWLNYDALANSTTRRNEKEERKLQKSNFGSLYQNAIELSIYEENALEAKDTAPLILY